VRSPRPSPLLPTALFLAVAFLGGCARPLGPGFHFDSRNVQIRAAEEPRRIHLRVADHMENSGDRPLEALDVRVAEQLVAESQLPRITVGEHETPLVPAVAADPGLMRASLEPVWEQREPREIVTEWDLVSGAHGRIAATDRAFYILDPDALPAWQPPRGVFTRGGPIADRESLLVYAPPDFRVLGPGRLDRTRRQDQRTVYRFRQRKEQPFLPFVIAGRYQERLAGTPPGLVSYWTFEPLESQQAEPAALRLANAAKAMEDYFGPVRNDKVAVRIVEAPRELPSDFGEEGAPGAISFPGGVLLDPRGFAQGLASDAVAELAEYELARTWFGWHVGLRPEAEILMGRGMGLFAVVVSAAARGAGEREAAVASLLQRYDRAQRTAADRSLVGLPGEYSRAERITTGYKAALFLVSLEELCGRNNLRAALTHIVRALGGDQTGTEELRAALEAECGRDLAEVFRAWLNRPGLPEEFSARVRRGGN